MSQNQLAMLVIESLSSRFIQVFGEAQSSTVSQFFLRHIAQIGSGFPGRGSTFLISDNNKVLATASAVGLNVIEKNGDIGINDLAHQGCSDLFARGATEILVVLANLPLIAPSDLSEVVAAGSPQHVVICPDKNVNGTNALCLSRPPVDFGFALGSNSFSANLTAARQSGLIPTEHFNSRIAYAIDSPEEWLKYLNSWHDRPRIHAQI